MKWIVVVLVILLILIVAVSVYAANFFLNVALFRDNKWYDTTGHKMMNPDNFNKGKSHYDLTEEKQNQQGDIFWQESFAQDYWLETAEEKLYSRLIIPHPESKKWVICVHGYRSYGQRDMAFVASRFSDQQYNILIPDLRAHGKSTGNVIGMGWLDRLDLLKWIQEIISMEPSAEIILFGGSMGAATVMMTSGEELPKNVKGLIVDCGYSSVYNEFGAMLRSAFKLPAFPILTIADYLAKKKVGYSLKEASSVDQLAKNNLPTLFIHGTGDKFVPHQMLYENMEATNGVKESLIVEKAPHLSSFIYEPDHYFGTVFEFIDRYC
ncbi:alpha/beta hydrolase [Candidatus Enterococcus ikei]|uniref:Alpha/beta hydrolase n=1 Tax=Candidatus Enterococcus ikei TaxID=2815326 RepID=A0ABS3GVY6_9ENTE|nr:alpha/beta hydrolase [Enterococcus sp. DIV0869a]MBO0439427.1 alpha/beta hydrolase [Enterococcus sp. DIV0869a]